MSHATLNEKLIAELEWLRGRESEFITAEYRAKKAEAEVERLQHDYDVWIEGKREDPEYVRLQRIEEAARDLEPLLHLRLPDANRTASADAEVFRHACLRLRAALAVGGDPE